MNSPSHREEEEGNRFMDNLLHGSLVLNPLYISLNPHKNPKRQETLSS